MKKLTQLLQREFGYMTLKDWVVWPIYAVVCVLPAYMVVAMFAIGIIMTPITLLVFGNALVAGGDTSWATSLIDPIMDSPTMSMLPWLVVSVAVPLSIWFTKPPHPLDKAIGAAHLARKWQNNQLVGM